MIQHSKAIRGNVNGVSVPVTFSWNPACPVEMRLHCGQVTWVFARTLMVRGGTVAQPEWAGVGDVMITSADQSWTVLLFKIENHQGRAVLIMPMLDVDEFLVQTMAQVRPDSDHEASIMLGWADALLAEAGVA
jgi:hypothetical protein